MKCFNHHESDAIGQCKHCAKGLCEACLTDLDYGIACKDKHESEVKDLHSLIQSNKKAYQSSPKASLFGPIFNIFMGIAFLYFGYGKGLDNFISVMGIGFIFFGISLLIYNRIFFKKVTTDYET